MKKNYYLAAFAVLALSVAPLANAADIKVDEGGPDVAGPQLGPNCDLTGYKTEVQNFPTPVAVPDNNPAGVTIGPITVPNDGSKFLDVIVGLNWNHTWLGDIVAEVRYDAGCDGSTDAAELLMCRPGRTVSCGATGTGVGCSSNFIAANTYNFSGDATASIPSTGCASATNVAGGCYKPTGLGTDGNLDAFDQLFKGGCFYLFVSDNAGADLGTITSWQVHTLNERPVPTEVSSWSQIKGVRHN